MLKPVKVLQYVSANKLVQAHNESLAARIKEVDGIDVSDEPMEWGDEDFSLNDEQIIEHLNKTGYWAFADTWSNTIHVWFDPRINQEQRFRVLAHEFAHLAGKPCKDPIKEEKRCDTFAEQAVNVYRLWTEV